MVWDNNAKAELTRPRIRWENALSGTRKGAVWKPLKTGLPRRTRNSLHAASPNGVRLRCQDAPRSRRPRQAKMNAAGRVTLRSGMLEPMLETPDLVVRYGWPSMFADRPSPAADGISFALNRRKPLGIVGENGPARARSCGRSFGWSLSNAEVSAVLDGDWLNITDRAMRSPRADWSSAMRVCA